MVSCNHYDIQVHFFYSPLNHMLKLVLNSKVKFSSCKPVLFFFLCIESSENMIFIGIFVGGSKVVHFNRLEAFSDAVDDEVSDLSSSCPTFPDCGFKLPNSGVVLSCLDCFLRDGSLYIFDYGVSPSYFLTRVRGGTCTTAASDPPEMTIHRAMYLLQNGFGNYNVFLNNCEDFALYCKTGLLTGDKHGVGSSGQASSIIGAPLAALLSSPLKLLIPSPVGVATVTAGMYCMNRYATDIGVRSDVVKVAVENLAEKLG